MTKGTALKLGLGLAAVIGVSRLLVTAQGDGPTPGTIRLGTVGQGAVYVGPHALGPGNGGGGGTIVYPTVYVTNLYYINAQAATNLWAGPTNTVDCNGGVNLYYASPTSTSLTGIINKPTTNAVTIQLTISNTSATNETFTIASPITTRDGARQYTITNGTDFIFSLLYNPGSGHTNSSYVIQF